MDQFDQAQAQELADYERNQARSIMPAPEGKSATHCEDCGVRIPAARRKAVPGVQRCIDCQAWDEEREKREGR